MVRLATCVYIYVCCLKRYYLKPCFCFVSALRYEVELKQQVALKFQIAVGSERDPTKTRLKLPTFKMVHVDEEEHWEQMKAKWAKGKPTRVNRKRQNTYAALVKQMRTPDDRIGWTLERQLGAMGLWEFTVRPENCRDIPTAALETLVECMKLTNAPNVVNFRPFLVWFSRVKDLVYLYVFMFFSRCWKPWVHCGC